MLFRSQDPREAHGRLGGDPPSGRGTALSLYLVLEGGDGVGKTHQAGPLREWLEGQGQRVRHVREPGSTTTGEAVRQLLLAPGTGGLSPWTEALLFSAALNEID